MMVSEVKHTLNSHVSSCLYGYRIFNHVVSHVVGEKCGSHIVPKGRCHSSTGAAKCPASCCKFPAQLLPLEL